MAAKASLFRLDPDSLAALASLSRLLGRPMNKLINEAVRDYLLKTSPAEDEIEATLESLRSYRERNLAVAEPAAAYSDGHAAPDVRVMSAARDFLRRVSAHHPFRSAFLFGSRARGTHGSGSDVDIAVLLPGPRGKLMEVSKALSDVAFDVLLETGLYIQPLPIWEAEWERPEQHSNPELLANIRRDGVPLF